MTQPTRFRSLSVLCSVAGSLLMLAPPAVAGEAKVTLADGRVIERCTLKPGAAPEQIVLERDSESPVTVTSKDLLVVDFGKVPGRPVPPTVRLVNGDQVFGKVSFPTPRQVRVAAGWGSVTLPLAWCAAIRLQEKAALPGAVTRDTLILKTDRVEGQIQGIKNGKVQIDLGASVASVEQSRVEAIALAPRDRSTDGRSGLLLSLDLGGGERLTGRWVKLSSDVLTIKADWNETIDVPVASLSSLEVKNGKLVYLSEAKPSDVKHTPFLDGTFPFQADRTVAGRPLRLGGKVYRRGLGVHSRSELTYTLDGGYEKFAATLGIDDEVAGQGSVVFRVFGDDKLLYESRLTRGGDRPVEIEVPMKGVLVLRLVVDYGDNGDVADHADWADARLLRP